MIESAARTTRGATDLRAMRGSTVATLGLMILVGGFLQLVLGIDASSGAPSLDARMMALTILTIASVVVALAGIPVLMRESSGTSARHPLLVSLVALTGAIWMLAVVAPFAGWAWAFLLAIAGGMLGCAVPGWWKPVVIVATDVVIGAGGVLGNADSPRPLSPGTSDGVSDYVIISTLVLFSVMPISAVWVLRVVLRLEQARQTAAELAIATERLRFATDLHDIQGHNLQVIALKSELAERLLPDRPDKAAAELAEVRRLAQAALDDTRAVVNDYRTVTVAVEARNAAAVLRSAGIRCEAQLDVQDMPPELGALFAMAIREAATNVLRHSSASGATIELVPDGGTGYRLTVVNDGAVAARHGGTGLAGLSRRVAGQGGTVETRRDGGGFCLIVRIPAPAGIALEAGR